MKNDLLFLIFIVYYFNNQLPRSYPGQSNKYKTDTKWILPVYIHLLFYDPDIHKYPDILGLSKQVTSRSSNYWNDNFTQSLLTNKRYKLIVVLTTLRKALESTSLLSIDIFFKEKKIIVIMGFKSNSRCN